MRTINSSLSLLLFVLIVSSVSHAKDSQRVLEGPYLGQSPPGLTPEPFAPGIVTTQGFDDGGVFSPNMDAFYFTRKRTDNNRFETVIYKQKGSQWFETISTEARPF